MADKWTERAKDDRREAKRAKLVADVLSGGLEDELEKGGRTIHKIVLKWDGWSYQAVFVVGNEDVGHNEVAFHSGETLASVFVRMHKRAQMGDIKWREDVPWEAKTEE